MKIAEGLFLERLPVAGGRFSAPTTVHHVAVVDCSGSMYGELPALREQLKTELKSLLREGDLLSVLWFSGRGESGVLLEAERVATLVDLQRVHAAIDRWLRPIGLTGFKEPLLEVKALLGRNATASAAASLFFMSDGCDNVWPRDEILATASELAPLLSSAVFVEYGHYADRPLLAEMARRTGGSLVFSKNFGQYKTVFSQALQDAAASPKVDVALPAVDAIDGLFWGISDRKLLTFASDGKALRVPATLSHVYYLAPQGTEEKETAEDESAVYAAASLFATRMRPEVVRPLLRSLGDTRLIHAFANCFGKQAYSSFMTDAARCATHGEGRFVYGRDFNAQSRPDAFTVLELLKLLADDLDSYLLLDHPEFHYERIGRARESESELRFVPDAAPLGYSAASLTYNETRPNISLLVRKEGHVHLSPPAFLDMPQGRSVPTEFPTHIWRNYTVIKDGIVNIDVLPVRPSEALRSAVNTAIEDGRLDAACVSFPSDGIWLFRLANMPVVNEAMVTSVALTDLVKLQYELTKARAAQKVFNGLKKELKADDDDAAEAMSRLEGKNEYEMVYGQEAAAWLQVQGLHAQNGFSPLGTLAEATDFYMGKELLVKLKGLSSLPSLAQVRERIAKGKLTASAALMAPSVSEVDGFLTSAAYTKAKKPHVVYASWLSSQAEAAVQETRQLIRRIAEIKFSIILGQVWFVDCKNLDDNVKQVEVDGNLIDGSAELREVEIPV